ncbi:MAG: YitT family protein [Candidatus Fimenecus sp.]
MEKSRKKLTSFLIDMLYFLLGGALYSVAVNCFTSRSNILNGGFTGLATVLNFLTGAPIGTVIFILNVPLFFLSYKKLGAKFVIRTAIATFIMSALIDLGTVLPVYKNDLLLSSLFGGALSGAGLGIVFIRNATTGGTDIIAKLIQLKFPHISIGRTILLFDLVIVILGGIVYRNAESMLYAAVVIFLSSQTIDYIIYGVNRGTMITVITEKGETVRNIIINELHRGVTVLKGHGGYTDGEKDVIMCACYDNQTNKFIKKIKSADEKAFFIVTQSKEILGEGFRNI